MLIRTAAGPGRIMHGRRRFSNPRAGLGKDQPHPFTKMRHRAGMGDEFGDRHHPPFLALVAKADGGDFPGQDRAVKHPGLPAGVVPGGKGPARQPVGRQAQAEFLVQLAQRATQRRLARLGAAAGQVPMRRKGDMVEIVAQAGQQAAGMGQQQLGADKA